MTRPKYGNKRTEVNGIMFDSRAESRRYSELVILEEAGRIKNLVIQPSYLLLEKFGYAGKKVQAVRYFADFEYTSIEDGKIHVEDVKGMRTEVYKIKCKFFLKKYGESLTFHEINVKS